VRKLILILAVAIFATTGFAQDSISMVNYVQFKKDFVNLDVREPAAISGVASNKSKVENQNVVFGAVAFISIMTISKFSSENFLTDGAYYTIVGITITGATIFVLTNKGSSWKNKKRRR